MCFSITFCRTIVVNDPAVSNVAWIIAVFPIIILFWHDIADELSLSFSIAAGIVGDGCAWYREAADGCTGDIHSTASDKLLAASLKAIKGDIHRFDLVRLQGEKSNRRESEC